MHWIWIHGFYINDTECDIYMVIYIYAENRITRIPYLCKISVYVLKAYVYDSCTIVMVMKCSLWHICTTCYLKLYDGTMLVMEMWNDMQIVAYEACWNMLPMKDDELYCI